MKKVGIKSTTTPWRTTSINTDLDALSQPQQSEAKSLPEVNRKLDALPPVLPAEPQQSLTPLVPAQLLPAQRLPAPLPPAVKTANADLMVSRPLPQTDLSRGLHTDIDVRPRSARPTLDIQLKTQGTDLHLTDKPGTDIAITARKLPDTSLPVSLPPSHNAALAGRIMPAPRRQQPAVSTKTASAGDMVSWDAWYERLGQLCDSRMAAALKQYGYPQGNNKVQLVIRRDHSVGAVIAVPGNPQYDAATLAAYRSIDGEALLEFPSGSQRNQVSLIITNKQMGNGPITDISGQRIRGDTEAIAK